ncbi:unnamed protein product, partial [Adineta steineri]
DPQLRQSDLTRSRTSSANSANTIFKPTTTSSPQKTPIELREELTSVRPRRPPRTAPSLSSSVSSLAGASNDSPRSSTTDVNVSGQFIIDNKHKKSLPSTHLLANKIRALTKSSEQLINDNPPRPPPKPPKFLH